MPANLLQRRRADIGADTDALGGKVRMLAAARAATIVDMRSISLSRLFSRARPAHRPPLPRGPEQRSTGEDAIRTAEQWSAEASAPGRPRLKATNL